METQAQQEVWLRGPVAGVPALLQPAAHALLQAMEEIRIYSLQLNDSLIWERPAGLASVAFHLQHITGVLDRLFTYARGEQLTDIQLQYLKKEGERDPAITLDRLLLALDQQIQRSVSELSSVDETKLTDTRLVGRKHLPSTVIGLLFHAAEHTQRHTGQLLATAKFLRSAIG